MKTILRCFADSLLKVAYVIAILLLVFMGFVVLYLIHKTSFWLIIDILLYIVFFLAFLWTVDRYFNYENGICSKNDKPENDWIKWR